MNGSPSSWGTDGLIAAGLLPLNLLIVGCLGFTAGMGPWAEAGSFHNPAAPDVAWQTMWILTAVAVISAAPLYAVGCRIAGTFQLALFGTAGIVIGCR
ncbi:hypothetical protein [Peterkaempfera bronchialis]|uniref:Uncharacterized protein n=1 Tax=Peterkaempfera bronchialis TaxID=2126346 RepID=A0A345T4G9_9ACTN|nr:hypothetical protein [Peterkaempfera bronchialis]AXI80874.1 hypothetical protein C7M71_029340 [Peterkaempfera bronchialis]